VGQGGEVLGGEARLIDEAAADVALTGVKQRLAALGFVPAAIRLADLVVKLASDNAKWSKVIRPAGIKAE
jgi:hypothetical protein